MFQTHSNHRAGQTPTHLWIRGGLRAEREALIASLRLPEPLIETVDAHRRLRGPYTAAGSIVRRLVPAILGPEAEQLRRYDVEALSVAPELASVLPCSRETLTSLAIPKERTRFYAPLRTRRIANGLVELIRDSLPDEQRILVLENVEHAEATDLELVTALIRRVDPGRLTVVVCSGATPPSEELVALLSARVLQHSLSTPSHRRIRRVSSEPVRALAARYVAGDCTSDDPELRGAYDSLDDDARAMLHERRAGELEALGERSLALGALPFHLEHGTDPSGRGAKALRSAQDYCVSMGFYTSVVELGERALALVDNGEQPDLWWGLTAALALALSVLSRTEDAEALYDEVRLWSKSPEIHMAAAYTTAMLYTRHNRPERRDDRVAKRWLNSAIATASLIAERSERIFQSAFYKNGLALVEANLGDPSEALRLVDECITSLDRDLSPEEHRLHRSVLKNNRARVYAMLGRLEESLADYAVVIADDPNHPEHYLERAAVLRRAGRTEEAFADYDRAVTLSPPFPEIYYNRGDLRAASGDVLGALDDFSYVIELEPGFVDAYVNRAALYLEEGEPELAAADAATGLELDPANANLLVVTGQVHTGRGEHAEARSAYDHAIEVAPDLVVAWSARGELAFEQGDFGQAVADLERAVELSPDDAALRYNRAMAYERAGQPWEALNDFELAAKLAPDDEEIAAASTACWLRLATV